MSTCAALWLADRPSTRRAIAYGFTVGLLVAINGFALTLAVVQLVWLLGCSAPIGRWSASPARSRR